MEMRNFIAGEWVGGAATVPNVNPSDVTDIVGEFAQADSAQLDEEVGGAVGRQRWGRPLPARR